MCTDDAPHKRRKMRAGSMGRSKDSGLASVELAMLLPFMLVLILLIANIGKFWHAKFDNRIAARTNAWRASEFNSLDLRLTGSLSCTFDSGQLKRAHQVTGLTGGLDRRCVEASGDAKLLTEMNSGSGGSKARKDALVGIIKAPANQPTATKGEAFRTWSTWKLTGQDVFWVSDSHTLDIAGTTKSITDPWLREELPKGYDAYLLKELLGGNSSNAAPSQEIACLQQQKIDADRFEAYEICLRGLTAEERAEEEDEKRCGDQPDPPRQCP